MRQVHHAVTKSIKTLNPTRDITMSPQAVRILFIRFRVCLMLVEAMVAPLSVRRYLCRKGSSLGPRLNASPKGRLRACEDRRSRTLNRCRRIFSFNLKVLVSSPSPRMSCLMPSVCLVAHEYDALALHVGPLHNLGSLLCSFCSSNAISRPRYGRILS